MNPLWKINHLNLNKMMEIWIWFQINGSTVNDDIDWENTSREGKGSQRWINGSEDGQHRKYGGKNVYKWSRDGWSRVLGWSLRHIRWLHVLEMVENRSLIPTKKIPYDVITFLKNSLTFKWSDRLFPINNYSY